MEIKIWNSKYIITSDARQYKLIELRKKALDEEDLDDEVYESDDGYNKVIIGYFPTIKYLLKSVAEKEGRTNRCTTMEGYIKHIEKINKQLEKTLMQIQSVVDVDESIERIINKMGDDSSEIKEAEEEKPKKKRGRKKKEE